ncbi:MAG: hypothetical protein KDA24_15820 [Deltaproteobacteria bacterium]|nr:hypothetical protein [Deltaproteobacteria bacterium]
MIRWLVAFAFTQVVEVPVWAAALTGRPWAHRIGLGFLASALTHPFVWFLFPPLVKPHLGWWGYLAVAETFAVLAEAALMKKLGVSDALLWALLANGLSAGLGFTFRQLFGWP